MAHLLPSSWRPLSRPVLLAGLSTVLVGSLAVSGCSAPAVKTAPRTTIKTTTKTAAPATKAKPLPFRALGVPAGLAAVIKPLYLGGTVTSSPSAATALSRRRPFAAAGPVVVKGSSATWNGVPIAVVTHGKDVTLAVKAPSWKVVGGWWPSVGVATPSLGGSSRRILLVGSDARPGQPVNGARGDSLHIVGLDGHGGGGILGIARDSYVNLASGGKGKINSALTSGGPSGLARTVVSATGVPVEGYMITGFLGFKRLINGIGGLRLNAPVAVRDAKSSANVKAGANKLSGVQALSYGRARHAVAGGDFGRSANQGLLILAAAGFARTAGPGSLPSLLHHAAPNIGTNLSAEQVLTFAAGVYVTRPKKVHNKVAAGSFAMTSDGQSIVLFDASARRMFADIRDGNLQ
jgi:LCP family protein required for cell wall assembly